jgi:NADPH:quinone reductase-like Zn-dependent oxidoreductase
LTDHNIGNSRDTSFEQLIMLETDGRGVDLILNSLSEEKLQASLRCLATGGRFLEIGKFDLANNNPLGRIHFVNLLFLTLLTGFYANVCIKGGEFLFAIGFSRRTLLHVLG